MSGLRSVNDLKGLSEVTLGANLFKMIDFDMKKDNLIFYSGIFSSIQCTLFM